MRKKKLKVIYISGIGRSGSTLLDMIIATNPKVFSVGEIYKYNNLKNNDTICSCGKPFKKCNFWKKFLKDNPKIINRMNFKDYFVILNYLYNPFKKKISFNNKSEDYTLFSKINQFAPKNTEYILDSSKDVARLMELNNNPKIDVYNISIFRDGRGVANSFNSKINNKKGKSYFISILKWIFVNTILIRYQKISNIKTLNISYESFTINPKRNIKKIEKFLNIKISKDYASIIRKMEYHNLAGNRLSLKKNRKKFDGIKYDSKWRIQQGNIAKIIATVMVYLFNKKWVYKK